MTNIQLPKAKEADVALLLEGSYPYILGGVSSWMHQIIQAYPDIKFAIFFIGSNSNDYPHGLRYKLPGNVVHMENYYLFPKKGVTFNNLEAIEAKGLRLFYEFIDKKLNPKYKDFFTNLNSFISLTPGDRLQNYSFTKKNWNYIVETYQKYCTEPSFIAYLWTILNLQQPVLEIINIIPNFIKVKTIHTISTGYAGLLGSLLNYYRKIPLILTEHGIYTKERRIELLELQSMKPKKNLQQFIEEQNYLTTLWMRFFDLLAKICYECSKVITSLYEGAREKQITEGADPKKTIVIPNGIDANKLKICIKQRPNTTPLILGFIGRVVPIKDIKTFIRAINIAKKQISNIQGWIIGPTTENPTYFKECKDLVSVLDLEENIVFKTDIQNLYDIYPKIGLLVLNSISEGLPLVILESFAAGVPVITTNVGACPELIYGRTKPDKALGPSGSIINIADPQALANNAVNLLQDETKWKQMQIAAIKRVETYYSEKTMFASFRKIYDDFLQN